MTLIKPERCKYGTGTMHRHIERCPDMAAPGSTYCAPHQAEMLAAVKANDNPRRAALKALRWGSMYVEMRVRRG